MGVELLAFHWLIVKSFINWLGVLLFICVSGRRTIFWIEIGSHCQIFLTPLHSTPYPHGQFGTQVPNNCFNYCKVILQFQQYFNQLGAVVYSNRLLYNFTIATLGMCIACEFHQLWAMRPCIYHIFWHLTK